MNQQNDSGQQEKARGNDMARVEMTMRNSSYRTNEYFKSENTRTTFWEMTILKPKHDKDTLTEKGGFGTKNRARSGRRKKLEII